MINIGIPSKGRLRKDVLKVFSKNKLKQGLLRHLQNQLGNHS